MGQLLCGEVQQKRRTPPGLAGALPVRILCADLDAQQYRGTGASVGHHQTQHQPKNVQSSKHSDKSVRGTEAHRQLRGALCASTYA